jgi:predicted helicase
VIPQANFLLPALSKEVEQAQEIKDKPILVITGNPPYNVKSKNTGEWITKLLKKAYFQVDGKPLNEKNPKNLLDDYVKFIRFAQWKMEQVDEGMVGIITNHSFLDNPTFRGMRQSLMKSFNQIYVLDLHGNVKKQETARGGSDDVNVFDIEQGVAISLFIKKQGIEQKIMRGDLWGARQAKYRALLETDITALEWETLTPDSPYYFFTSQNTELRGEYNKFQSITGIFVNYSSGVKTSNDELLVGFDSMVLSEKLKGSVDNFEVGKIKNIMYRSLDNRVIYYDTHLVARARESLMKHMLDKENLGIIFTRQIVGGKFDHVLVSGSLVCHGTFYLGNKGQDYLAPLYLYNFHDDKKPKATLFDEADPFGGKERIENFAPAFRKFIDDKYGKHYEPEQIMGYIYAVLHSPTYRSKYLEFLKIDFPRIPFVDDVKIFEKLSALGWQLVQAHLLKVIPAAPSVNITKGNMRVEKPVYVEEDQQLYINKDQYFSPISKDVWEFYIGGYPVLDKYLKSRKDRTLTLDEIENIQNVVKVLALTITQMQKIDEAWKP